MSELINKHDNRATIRWKLLASASAVALLASAFTASEVLAADSDSDRPLFWIELGGQLDKLNSAQEEFSPPFIASITKPGLLSALNVQQPAGYALDAHSKITFQPEDSDWAFSASVQFGRSRSVRHHHQQTANARIPVNFAIQFPPPYSAFGPKYVGPKYYYPYQHVRFSDGTARESEHHIILDFQAGKDVGLGLFGSHGSSTLSAGVRIAQFASKSKVTLRALPDLQYPTTPIYSKYAFNQFKSATVNFHAYSASAEMRRSFRGLGPSLSWDASVPFAGNSESGTLTFDWGVNAAVLFGRQRAKGHHQTNIQTYHMTQWVTKGGARGATTGNQKNGFFTNPSARKCGFAGYPSYCQFGNYHYTNDAVGSKTIPGAFDRSRNVTVPNLGGFAGISFRYSNAKVSFGYKADFFFNAIDGGIDTRKTENRGFFGPYASISIGLGD